jgi:hypothetical protein
MNTPTKSTAMATALALMLVLTVSWVLSLYGLKIPDNLSSAWMGGLTVLLAYFIHDPTESK